MGNIKMGSKLYDFLKPVALVYLPAAATLWFAVASIWGIPGTSDVVATISAVDAFLGAALGYSSKNYSANNDGQITHDGVGFTGVQLPNVTAEDLLSRKQVVLKVVKDSDAPSAPVQPAV